MDVHLWYGMFTGGKVKFSFSCSPITYTSAYVMHKDITLYTGEKNQSGKPSSGAK